MPSVHSNLNWSLSLSEGTNRTRKEGEKADERAEKGDFQFGSVNVKSQQDVV